MAGLDSGLGGLPTSGPCAAARDAPAWWCPACSPGLQCRVQGRRGQCPGCPGCELRPSSPLALDRGSVGLPPRHPSPHGRGCGSRRGCAPSPGPRRTYPRRQLTAEGSAPRRRPHCLPAAPGSRPTPQTAFSSGALWEPRWQERRKEQPTGLGGGKTVRTERRREGVGRRGGRNWKKTGKWRRRESGYRRGGERGDRRNKTRQEMGAGGGKKGDQRGNEKGDENTGRKTEKRGGLVSASPRGGPSSSAASHPCPSSSPPGKRGSKALPNGGRG